MKIVTNGCSFTFGHKGSVDSQAPNWVWPSRLNDMNDITKVVNLAVEGASNDRVVRTSIEYFEKNKGIDLNNAILVVQHPTPNRGEWFNIENKLWIGYVTTMEDVLYDISVTDYTKQDLDKIKTDTETERKVFDQYKKFVESDITEIINYFKNIRLLQTYCKQKEIKLLQVGLSARCIPELYFREENTFKIRPGVAYDKFYINQVEGSYDMSLQGLLHHYLWENELYHLFLSDEELETCRQVVEEQPEYIFGPDDGKTQEIIDEIQYKAISFVGKKLIELGFDVEQDFESYLN